MNLSTVIALLEGCPGVDDANTMAGRVSVAPTAQIAFEQTLAFPFLWVVSVSGTSTPGKVWPLVRQRHGVDFGVLAVVRDLGDKTGAAASASVNALRFQVFDALLGKVPDTGFEPLEHRSDSLAEYLDGKLAWVDMFATSHTIRSNP